MARSKIMNKVSLMIKSEDIEKTTHTLYDLQLIEFFSTEHKKLEDLSLKELDKESKEIVELRTAITQLKPYFSVMSGAYSKDSIQKVKELTLKEKKLSQQLLQVKDAQTREKVKTGLRLTPLNIKSGVIGYVDAANIQVVENFKKQERKVKLYTLGERTYFYSPEQPTFSFKEYFIPQEVKKTDSKLDLEKEHNYVISQLKTLANANLRHLQAQELKLSKEIEVEQSKEKFKKSKHHVVLQGYVPQSEIHNLDIAMQSELADKYSLEVEEAGDNAPILLPNKGIVKAFESLLSMYSLPKYREIDPSILMVFFFPVFFGFILGDFGYGLTSFLVFTVLKAKLPEIKNMLSVMQLSAVSSMLFGIWYGEYFGFEPKLFPFEFHRSHDPNTLLGIAVIFGFLHINAGLFVGILNNLNNFKKIMCDYVSWYILQAGVACFYFASVLGNPNLNYVAWVLIVISAVLLFKGHGIGGIIEMPSIFANMLSYARLMAVGLSSIVIAVLVNQFSVPLIQGGVVSAIFGIVLFTIGHVFNIILGNFEGFLHTLRLHYVEFFTKFYEGGGEEFKPFGSSKIKHE